MSNVKRAWARIRQQYAEATQRNEGSVYGRWGEETPSINDSIQREYREGRVTEAERDEMRRHTEEWLPNRPRLRGGATYSCGMWAPSVGPMGQDEHGIILATVVILEEEAA